MRDLHEAVERLAADALRGRVGRQQLRVSRGFERAQLVHALVILRVGPQRLVEHVVQVLVVAQLFAEGINLVPAGVDAAARPCCAIIERAGLSGEIGTSGTLMVRVRLGETRSPKTRMAHMVFCTKYKAEMEGLDEPPFDSDFGQKIYKNVSQKAWGEWVERQKMLLNEYRLQPWTREAQEFLVEQMNEFFFGGELPKAATH